MSHYQPSPSPTSSRKKTPNAARKSTNNFIDDVLALGVVEMRRQGGAQRGCGHGCGCGCGAVVVLYRKKRSTLKFLNRMNGKIEQKMSYIIATGSRSLRHSINGRQRVGDSRKLNWSCDCALASSFGRRQRDQGLGLGSRPPNLDVVNFSAFPPTFVP